MCYSRAGAGRAAAAWFCLLLGMGAQWGAWIYRALTFLVVSCPCALVISIPLSFFAGIGGASKEGVLVKGSNYLETLSQTKTVVFDKTGTLTQGVFEVSGVHHSEMEDAKLLEYAALAECASSHPISKSLQKAYGREIDRSRVSDIRGDQRRRRHGRGGRHAGGCGQRQADANSWVWPNRRTATAWAPSSIWRWTASYAGHIVISDIVKPHRQGGHSKR